ncbi:hypothetical protein GX50_03076 [[Emmonsia] crescens]|uniref:Uncharacterized protein n=1 Tax=[Emmonsia] crescens TaxID=73230 RepID=A0A2B7ZLR1_9EURO|nr:hypothetical protein GX50_03076 [Emmonsia crescens]
MQLNESTMKDVNDRYESCGYAKFMNDALQFTPTGKLPAAPKGVVDFCPYLWNVLGFPSLAGGPNNYFNRTDVQKTSNAPPTNYMVCSGQYEFFPGGDKSTPSGLRPLPNVIEKTNNTIIGHGALDFLLF